MKSLHKLIAVGIIAVCATVTALFGIEGVKPGEIFSVAIGIIFLIFIWS